MIRLSLLIRPCAKPRPRVTRWGAYMPKGYRAWQDDFRAQVSAQYSGEALPKDAALCMTATIRCRHMRPDADNACGALLDALQPWPILNDSQIKELHVYVVEGQAVSRTDILLESRIPSGSLSK
jgi:Holliday junction resolvase RusA-like endonuclease